MSEKFRSASNEVGNTESAGSLKEKLNGTSAPDAGVDGDLDIQDLLKKYLPEFAEEAKTEDAPAEVIPAPAAAVETEIVEDVEEEREEEEVRSGFFARLRASVLKEEEEPVIPDMSLYEEISAENGNDFHAEEELVQLNDEELPEATEDAPVLDEEEDAPAEMDETDLNLLMGLGLEDQIDKTVGEGTADMMAAQNDEDIRRLEEEKRRAGEYEYTEREQTPRSHRRIRVPSALPRSRCSSDCF